MFKQKFKNQKGFMSIEAIFAMTTVLMVTILSIGFFSYMIPKQGIEEEVHLLGKIAKMNGTLTYTKNPESGDIADFKNNLVRRNLLDESKKNEVEVMLETEDTTGGDREQISFGNPIARSEKTKNGKYKVIKITVEVPAKRKGLMGALKFFNIGENSVSDKYIFTERVMSEKFVGKSI